MTARLRVTWGEALRGRDVHPYHVIFKHGVNTLPGAFSIQGNTIHMVAITAAAAVAANHHG